MSEIIYYNNPAFFSYIIDCDEWDYLYIQYKELEYWSYI